MLREASPTRSCGAAHKPRMAPQTCMHACSIQVCMHTASPVDAVSLKSDICDSRFEIAGAKVCAGANQFGPAACRRLPAVLVSHRSLSPQSSSTVNTPFSTPKNERQVCVERRAETDRPWTVERTKKDQRTESLFDGTEEDFGLRSSGITARLDTRHRRRRSARGTMDIWSQKGIVGGRRAHKGSGEARAERHEAV